MTTEQYSIGYEAGYQDGFDAALAQPVKQEPVAYWDEKSGEVCRVGWLKFHAREHDKDRFTTPLYAEPVSAEAIRAEAYQQGRNEMKEEAAKVCEERGWEFIEPIRECAAAIRNLKDKA